jgi:Zn-dependent peptidase ImmA (M78 family)
MPNVVFRRMRDLVEISWEDERLVGTPPGFHFSAASGVARVAPDLIAGPLYDLATAACSYLLGNNPGSRRLGLLRANLTRLAQRGHHDVRLSWLAGLRSIVPLPERLAGQGEERRVQDRWPEVVATLRELDGGSATTAALATEPWPDRDPGLVLTGSCQAALLFGSVAPTVSEKDVRTLAQVLIEQYQSATVQRSRLEALTEEVPLDPAMRAWEQGYELAESLHELLRLSGEPVDIRGLIEDLDISVVDRELEDSTVRGCSIVGPQHKPTIVMNRGSRYAATEVAVRFTLAHELCHILFDRSHGRRLAIASGPWAPRGIERRANAFAAMFLMPSALVQRAVADSPDPITDLNGVAAVAQRLNVSRRAVIEHLYNLTLMAEAARDELLGRAYPD